MVVVEDITEVVSGDGGGHYKCGSGGNVGSYRGGSRFC
jgi:hypothetical protein